ncbi:MAG TPA: histidine phosphatase family protein [Candidatus Limnocylindria bacterium]|nr:histidine phosphatase family protein [Candidatus Limnocylindria bacterium]
MPERLPLLNVLLVRHAASVPPGSAGWEERDDDRPLTEAGRRAADELADELEPFQLHAIYSSPYARAIATVTPTAQRRMMTVQLLPEFRERRLTTESRADWRDHLERSWREPDYRLPGAESGREAQQRARSQLDLLRSRHAAGGTVLVGSHGNLISLLLATLEPGVDLEFHLDMPTPAIYHLQHDGVGWRVMGGHGFREVAADN